MLLLRPGEVLGEVGGSLSIDVWRAAVLCCLFLCACAAREVQPVAMSQPGDDQLSCADLDQQLSANEQSEAVLIGQDRKVAQGNVAKTIGGAIPVAGIAIVASTDLSNSEQVRARALADRNQELSYLSSKKGCTK